MNKLIVIIILIGLVAGILWGTYSAGVDSGYNKCQKELKDSNDEAEAEDKTDVKEIIKWRTETKVITRDKIKKIYITKDSTGCADVKLIDMGFGLQ